MGPIIDKSYNMTTNHEFFGRPEKETAHEIIAKSQAAARVVSGNNDRPTDQQGLKMTSVLTGEKYKNRKNKNFKVKDVEK